MFTRGKLALAVLVALVVGAAIVGLIRRDSSDAGASSGSVQSNGAGLAASDRASAVTVPIERAAAEIERLTGNRVPPASCLVRFAQPDCRAVSEVVIVPATSGEGGNDYVPLVTGSDSSGAVLASTGTGRLVNHGTLAACGVIAYRPALRYSANTYHEHHCLPGQYISRMEMWGDLQRYQGYPDYRWYTLDNCYRGPYYGATTQSCRVVVGCNHPTVDYSYRGATSGYAVQRGVGFFGTDYSAIRRGPCY
jgi:hypothetical protein